MTNRRTNQTGSDGSSGSARIASAPVPAPPTSARTGPSRRTIRARKGPRTSIASACVALFKPISEAGTCQRSSVSEASGNSIPSVRPAPALPTMTAASPIVRWRALSVTSLMGRSGPRSGCENANAPGVGAARAL